MISFQSFKKKKFFFFILQTKKRKLLYYTIIIMTTTTPCLIGSTILYNRNPALRMDAYPGLGSQQRRGNPTVYLDHVRDNTWRGVVVGCSAPPNHIPVGEIDPRTGQKVQWVYQVRSAGGTREVKATNVLKNLSPLAQASSSSLPRGTPTDLYNSLR